MSYQLNLLAIRELNFTALDFETLNDERSSLCAIGVVQVRDGRIARTWKQLVRPREMRAGAVHFSVHRITLSDLEVSPKLEQVWEQLCGFLDGELVVAHNAEFDLAVLRSAAGLNNLILPSFRSLCTLKLARLAYPDLEHHGLSDMCEHLGVALAHHDYLEDARGCAELAVRALPLVHDSQLDLYGTNLTSSSSFEKEVRKHGYDEAKKAKDFDRSLLRPDFEGRDNSHPFYKAKVVFTGDLVSMDRQEAASRVQQLGADINQSISKLTKFVIVGASPGPSKMAKVAALKAAGADINVLEEDEFRAMLDSSPTHDRS
ncbi:MAG: 3'-5' exoribonuclease [Flavobacteriales bacterium]|nr:MAG: 3'-5' exoribonuclease [Flavobacteriales bacterium]